MRPIASCTKHFLQISKNFVEQQFQRVVEFKWVSLSSHLFLLIIALFSKERVQNTGEFVPLSHCFVRPPIVNGQSSSKFTMALSIDHI